MALKAGRVGVAPSEVDRLGKIIGGGSSSGVTDVKVDGISVVEDGEANIILPVQRLQEVETAAEADVLVMTIGTAGTMNTAPLNRLQKTTITVDGAAYDVATYDSQGSSSSNMNVSEGQKFVLTRCIDNAGGFTTFASVVTLGLTGRIAIMAVQPTENQYYLASIVNVNNNYIYYTTGTSTRALAAFTPSYKFYKIV